MFPKHQVWSAHPFFETDLGTEETASVTQFIGSERVNADLF